MRRIGRTKHLSCFYCGKQTGLKYDGSITNFLCLSCDATNYLDQHGDITDPPVATDREAAAPSQYARPQQPTSAATSPDIVFCKTCLKNQRLFTASLAQYLPDDPSHPDYDELDRNYYRYRRNLERRYPQVCDGCADRVQQRIRQAGYTAKTDHLRRMMDKSRGRRSAAGATTRRAGALDAAATLGRWLWRGGLAAQLLWHALHMVEALERPDDGMYDPDDAGVFAVMLSVAKATAAWLPGGDALMQLSIAAAVLSSWWNPHFVQFTRGFTRHLLGFTRWYSFQGLIVFFRIFFRSVLSMEGGAARSQSAQLSAHLATAGIVCFIYMMASRSIRVDTTPLFRSEEKAPTPRRNMSPAKRKEEDSKTFSELCNEALDSTPRKGRPSSPLTATPGTPNYASSSTFVPPSQIKLMQQQQQRGLHESPLASASAFQPRSQQKAPIIDDYDDADAMDWSPSQPQHRAFRNTPDRATTNARRPFSQSPTHADDGGSSTNPFWFKVPPAPTTPARLLRNPPNMPVLRQKPAEPDDVFFSSRSDKQENRSRSSSSGDGGGVGDTSFRNPSFFAPEKNDEANSLADLLGESFTLGHGQQQQQQQQQQQLNQPHAFSPIPSSPFSVKRRTGPQHQNNNVPYPARRQPVELVVLAVLLPLWLLLSFALPASTNVAVLLRGIVLVVAGVVALSGTHELESEGEDRQQPRLVDAALSALGVAELAAVCWVGWETWTARVDVRAYGAGVLAVMLAHHAARLLQA